MAEKRPMFVVEFTIDPDKDDEFSVWYHDYLATLVPIAPDWNRR